MIKLTEEYSISTSPKANPLRHWCRQNKGRSNYFAVVGAPVLYAGSRCVTCKKQTPSKILFMYNLWKWQNDKNY